ncbi:MAG: hypothetical protein QGH40_16670 [bacterium]|nr:hypothetical protein [bacterium]
MPEGEEKEVKKTGGNNTIKYLLGAIGVLLFILVMLFVVKQISQSTYQNQIQEGAKSDEKNSQEMSEEAKPAEAGAPPQDITGKTDLTVSTKDDMMCVMRFSVVVSRADILPIVLTNITRIMNEVLRLISSMEGEVLKEGFRDGTFNEEMVRVLNKLLKGEFQAQKGFMDKLPVIGNPTERKIIRIDITKFQVVAG